MAQGDDALRGSEMDAIHDISESIMDRIASMSIATWANIVAFLIAVTMIVTVGIVIANAFAAGRSIDRGIQSQTTQAFAITAN